MINFEMTFEKGDTSGKVTCRGEGRALVTTIEGEIYPAALNTINKIVQVLKSDHSIAGEEAKKNE